MPKEGRPMRVTVRALRYAVFFYACFILAPVASFAATAHAASARLTVFGIAVDTAFLLSMSLSFVIPLLSSLLSRTHWPSEVTALLTLAIAAVNGFLTESAQSSDVNHYNWKHALMIALGSWIVAVLARLGIWQGTKTDAKALAIGSRR
jgi:hypothetical protein